MKSWRRALQTVALSTRKIQAVRLAQPASRVMPSAVSRCSKKGLIRRQARAGVPHTLTSQSPDPVLANEFKAQIWWKGSGKVFAFLIKRKCFAKHGSLLVWLGKCCRICSTYFTEERRIIDLDIWPGYPWAAGSLPTRIYLWTYVRKIVLKFSCLLFAAKCLLDCNTV